MNKALVLIFSLSLSTSVLAQQSQTVLSDFTKVKSQTEAYHQQLNALEWKNPSPGIDDLGLDVAALKNLVGDRIVLMMHPPRDIDVPYYGSMIRWHNARFVSAVTEVPMGAAALRQMIIDHDQQDGWKKIEPFVRSTEVLYKSKAEGEPEQVGLEYKIRANISIIRVNGTFHVRNTYEDSQSAHHSITSLFLHADIGVSLGVVPILPKAVLSPLALANVRRWEFVEIDKDRSLVVITDWAEVLNNTPLSKQMSQYDEGSTLGGLSDEELVGPYPGVAVNMYNFKHTILKALGTQKAQAEITRATVPDFIHQLSRADIEKVLPNGPVVFMHPTQVVTADYGDFPMHFVTAVYGVKANVDELRGLSSQMNHYADFIPQLESSKLVKGNFDMPDFDQPQAAREHPELDLSLNLGRKSKLLSSFKLEYRIRYIWERANRLYFEGIGGDIETVQGAIEWLPGSLKSKEPQSLLFYTVASDLGPKPKFPLNLSQKIPGADVASGVMISAMFVGRQGPWVEMKLEKSLIKEE